VSPRRPGRLRTVAPRGVLEAQVPFAVLCCAVIVMTLLSVLAINIALSRGSYAAGDLRRERRLLVEEEQALRERLAAAEAPGALERRAAELGMVPGDLAAIYLAERKVLGEPRPAAPPSAAPSPAAQPPVTETTGSTP